MVRFQPAILEQVLVIGHPPALFVMVAHPEERRLVSLLILFEKTFNPYGIFGIEVRRRFVQEQRLR